MQANGRLAAKWLVALMAFGLVLLAVDAETLWHILRQADPGWLLAALAVSVGQVVLSAWRWRYTAWRLGLALRLPMAIREYYLSTLLNQVLPGGVLGDAGRAVRHGLAESRELWGSAVRAVMIERLSGQLVLLPVVALALWFVPFDLPWPASETVLTSVVWGLVVASVILGLGLVLLRRLRPLLARVGQDVQQALLRWPALPIQVTTSALVLGSYILVFWLVVQALGVETPPAVLLPLIPLTLLAMLVPFTVSGWGVREGAAAALWALSGLSASEGVAISVGYGLVVLVSSLPGLWVLLRPEVKQQVRAEVEAPVGGP